MGCAGGARSCRAGPNVASSAGRWLAPLVALLGACGTLAWADSSSSSSSSAAPSDDADLIEFLGGVGAEDEDWLNYLSQTDPTKVATAPRSPPPSGGAKHDE